MITNFIKSLKGWKLLKSTCSKKRRIVFYAESPSSYRPYEELIKHLTMDLDISICYLTSSSIDPILDTNNRNISSLYIGKGFIRTLVFMTLKAKLMIMTTPDLENLHIKRSRTHSVHYLYIFHSIVSTQMNYREKAFDHFDTIFCVGEHHVKELEMSEQIFKTKKKCLVEYGHGTLDNLVARYIKKEFKTNPKQVLIAPSWGNDGILNTCSEDLIEVLLNTGYFVILRPHPESYKFHKKKIDIIQQRFIEKQFILETDLSKYDSYFNSSILISDWGGASLEYVFATCRPVIYIDVPAKIKNPNFKTVPIIPIEIIIREVVGKLVAVEQLDTIPSLIGELNQNQTAFQERIVNLRNKTIYNNGASAIVGGKYISNLLSSLEDCPAHKD